MPFRQRPLGSRIHSENLLMMELSKCDLKRDWTHVFLRSAILFVQENGKSWLYGNGKNGKIFERNDVTERQCPVFHIVRTLDVNIVNVITRQFMKCFLWSAEVLFMILEYFLLYIEICSFGFFRGSFQFQILSKNAPSTIQKLMNFCSLFRNCNLFSI